MPPTAKRQDPLPNYAFRVLVDDLPAAEFSECSGLEMTVKFDEVREGGQNGFVHKLPGRVEYGNLVLKRGYARSGELLKWCLQVPQTLQEEVRLKRRKVTVQLVEQASRSTIVQWIFDDAYPVKWSGPSLKASENGVAIESLELAHRGLLAG
jgi:phage tail-like protein